MASWYYSQVIIPWRARQTASHVVITNDPLRESQILRKAIPEMAGTMLLENINAIISQRKVPSEIECYYVQVVQPGQVYLTKHRFGVDIDSLKALDKEDLLLLEKEGVRGAQNLWKEGKIKIYVEGFVVKDGVPVLRKVNILEGVPEPAPLKMVNKMSGVGGLKGMDVDFEVAERIDEIRPIPEAAVFNYLLRRYYFGEPEVAVFTAYTNAKLRESDLNERVILSYLMKDVAKHPIALRKSSLFLAMVPSLSFVPPSVRDLVNIVDKSNAERDEIRREIERTVGYLKKRGLIRRNYKIGEELVESALGLSLDEVQSALKQSVYLYGEIKPEIFRDMKIKKLRDMGVRYIEPKITLSAVGGLKALKEEVTNRVINFAKHPELAEKYNIPPPRGFLLAGIGGTGKTWFVKALAGELGRPVIQLNAADFMSKYVGESEQNLKRILSIAEQMNAIVFIDEIDAIAMSRESVGAGDSGTTRRIINQIMEYLGDRERKAMVIGATNVIHQMDENFLRAGRFDKIYHVSPPDYEGRLEVLKIHALALNPPEKGVTYEKGVFERVARETHLWVGAELEALVTEAKKLAALEGSDKITYEHFERAMSNFKINIEQRKQQIRNGIDALENIPQGIVVRATLEEARQILGESMTQVESIDLEDARFEPISDVEEMSAEPIPHEIGIEEDEYEL